MHLSLDFDIKKFLEAQTEQEPLPDIAICSQCNWRGPISECVKEKEGDWESGYYVVDCCPICQDGGCIDNYEYSPKQLELWKDYQVKHAFKVPANMIGKNK